MFDANGCLMNCFNKQYNSYNNWELSIALHDPWLSMIYAFLKSFGVHVQRRSLSGIMELRIAGRIQVCRILKYMNSYTGIRLMRKKQKADILLKKGGA
jgi:hypothetical protein